MYIPEDGVDGDAAGEDLEKHEVHVRGEAAEELDPGRLVVFGVEGEREDDPHRREDHHYPREGVELPAGPVLDANHDLINYRMPHGFLSINYLDGALPQVAGVGLHRRVGDDLLQLALDEDVKEGQRP